jgi:hypothetical protein
MEKPPIPLPEGEGASSDFNHIINLILFYEIKSITRQRVILSSLLLFYFPETVTLSKEIFAVITLKTLIYC